MKHIIRLITCLCLSQTAVMSVQAFFEDVDVTHPYYFSIRDLYDNRVVEGYRAENGNAYYRPLNAISRVEALKILLLASDVELSRYSETIFPDVESKSWYEPYVVTAYNRNIVQGFQDGRFYPSAEVSKAQMLKMTLVTFGAELEDEDSFDQWYQPYMNFAKEFNIIEEDGNPNSQLTRGEVAEIIYRTKFVADSSFTKKYTYSGFGLASYYAGNFHGRPTASGEIYNKDDLTAAHRTLPFGTRLKITYQDKSVIVRINDRGPYHENRIIDLSEGAFKKLSHTGAGVLSVAFELYTEPEESDNPIPEYIREELEAQTRNPVVPEVVSDHLNKRGAATLTPRTNYMEGSIPHLPVDFYPTVTLNRPFPQKVYAGDMIYLSGRTKVSRPGKVFAFLQPGGDTNDVYRNIEGTLSGNRFEIPISFLQEGSYKMGIIVGDARESVIQTITVLPRPNSEYFGSGKAVSSKVIPIDTIPKNQEIILELPENVIESSHIYKILLHQESKTIDLRVEGGIPGVRLPRTLFSVFHTDDPVFIDIYRADGTDGILSQQTSAWNQTHRDSYLLTEVFPDTQTDTIEIFNFEPYLYRPQDVVLQGKRSGGVRLNGSIYVTKRGEFVRSIPIDFETDTYFSVPLSFDDYGTYIIEFIGEDGSIVFNKAVYVYPQSVMPILPWNDALSISPSRTSMLYWMNSIREKYKKQGLVLDEVLNNFAQDYAQNMADQKFISHTDLSGRNFEQRVDDFGLKGEYGENLSYGSTLELALHGLENSGSHLENMIQARWTAVGIGFAKTSKGEYYVTHVFSR